MLHPKEAFLWVDGKDGTVAYWFADPGREAEFVSCMESKHPTVMLQQRDANWRPVQQ